ncbi:MAG TPA: hypothetical protein VFI12_03435 [Thermomicrobiales bacterium]|nr:hypothetical protein [Thermomicrobiales bacterium]
MSELIRLPFELRGALDYVAFRTGGVRGETGGRVVGDPILVNELGRYAPIAPAPETVIVLLGQSEEIAEAVAQLSVTDAWIVTAGPLDRLMRPLRTRTTGEIRPSAAVPAEQWRALGFERIDSTGIQGIGSIAWAVAERICRRFDRPDLADRCRIAMLRTLKTAGPMQLGAIRVDHHRRMGQTR